MPILGDQLDTRDGQAPCALEVLKDTPVIYIARQVGDVHAWDTALHDCKRNS